MKDRIRYAPYKEIVMEAGRGAAFIRRGMTVAVGGYTSSGYPKATLKALAAMHGGDDFSIAMLTGSTNGPLDELLSPLLSRRAPMIESKALAGRINKGEVAYVEQQMNRMPRLIREGAFGKIDIAVVEAVAITESGGIVPSCSCGMTPNLLDAAERVIIEINAAQPEYLEGMHDIFGPKAGEPIPLTSVCGRIGAGAIAIDPAKVIALVLTDEPDETKPLAPATDVQRQIVKNLLAFLEEEAQRQGWRELPPVQTGFGNMAGEIVNALGRSSFENIRFFCGGIQEENVLLLQSGKAAAISCGSIKMTPAVTKLLEDESIRSRIIIRNGELTNSSEVISRMGLIALNSGIEADIYGNVNSSHILGSRIVNGLGGGANFAQNAGLSVMLIPSEGKGGAISTIVPMVSHQDISEHDIDVIITENGVADLRGRCDTERAHAIIDRCASERYRPLLNDYLSRAIAEVGGHHPMLLSEALSWHIRLKETGGMLPQNQ